jgi:hypothetical protein
MNFITLLEELKDIPTHNILYHGTNFYYFYQILKSGYLKGSEFYTTTDGEKKAELATSRKAGIIHIEKTENNIERRRKMRDLSSNIGAIRFHLFKDRIVGNKEIRGVKVKPIAEIPKTALYGIKKQLEDYYHITDKKTVNNFINAGIEAIQTTNTVSQFIKKLEEKTGIKKDNSGYAFYNFFKNLKKYTLEKEFEERIVFKKKSTGEIPLKPELMRIELLDEIVEDVDDYLNDYVKENIEEHLSSSEITKMKKWLRGDMARIILDLIENKKDLFIKNNNYKKFIEHLTNLLN